MRTKKAFFNSLTAGLLHTITLIFGLIIPRLIIKEYGSEINGLVTSTKQLISYLQYLELGLSGSLIYLLYKPMTNLDKNQINSLMNRASKEFKKISIYYLIGIVFFSIIYPLMLSSTIKLSTLMIIVFILGLNGLLQFYTLASFRVILSADQKAYVISIASIIYEILRFALTYVLIITSQSILLVIALPLILVFVKSGLILFYVKKKYKFIKKTHLVYDEKIESRFDVVVTSISTALNTSLPILAVSLVVSLEEASIFSVYNMVFAGISGILIFLRSGMSDSFGNVIASGEEKVLLKSKNYFEFVIFFAMSVIFSAALILIIPFIKIYMSGTGTDIIYVYPIYGILFTIWALFHNARIPFTAIIIAGGNWRKIRKINILQIILLLLSTFLLGYIWGIIGILIGMIISAALKTIVIIYIVNHKILKINVSHSLFRLLRMFVILAVTYLPFYLNLTSNNVHTIFNWVLLAIVVTFWTFFVTLISALLFDYNTLINFFNIYILTIIKKPFKKDNKFRSKGD